MSTAEGAAHSTLMFWDMLETNLGLGAVYTRGTVPLTFPVFWVIQGHNVSCFPI